MVLKELLLVSMAAVVIMGHPGVIPAKTEVEAGPVEVHLAGLDDETIEVAESAYPGYGGGHGHGGYGGYGHGHHHHGGYGHGHGGYGHGHGGHGHGHYY